MKTPEKSDRRCNTAQRGIFSSELLGVNENRKEVNSEQESTSDANTEEENY